MANANMVLWLCMRSTFLMAHSGSVKPFPAGPVPWVWPVNELDEAVLAVLRKLEACVEKHMYCSERCSFPT